MRHRGSWRHVAILNGVLLFICFLGGFVFAHRSIFLIFFIFKTEISNSLVIWKAVGVHFCGFLCLDWKRLLWICKKNTKYTFCALEFLSAVWTRLRRAARLLFFSKYVPDGESDLSFTLSMPAWLTLDLCHCCQHKFYLFTYCMILFIIFFVKKKTYLKNFYKWNPFQARLLFKTHKLLQHNPMNTARS